MYKEKIKKERYTRSKYRDRLIEEVEKASPNQDIIMKEWEELIKLHRR